MKKIFKKTMAILALVAVIFTNIPVYVFAAEDTTIPTVTISGIPSGTVVNEGGSLTFKVYFDDETELGSTYLVAKNIKLNGFTANVNVSGTGAVRTVTLTNMQGAGSGKSVTIAAGAASDMSGNESKAVTSRTFTIKAEPKDTTIPTVVVAKPSSSTVALGGTVSYKVYFDDETALGKVNFNANYVTLNGFTASVSVSGSGATRTVTLTNVQGAADSDNYITVKAGSVLDAAGNSSKAVSSAKFTIYKKDATIPTVVISKPSSSTVALGGTVSYTVYFDDETALGNVNFNANYVTLNGFTASVAVSGTGAKRTVTLTNVQGAVDADNGITVKAGAVLDAAGNSSKAVSSAKFAIYKKDATIPTVIISKPSADKVALGGTVSYTVYFDDETELGKINFNSNYVTLNGFTASVAVSGTGAKRTVTLTNVQGAVDADNGITVKAGAVLDAAGNSSKAVTSAKFEMYKVDTTIPTVTVSKPSPVSIYAGETVKYTVYFDDETKVGTIKFNKDYVTLHGFTANVAVSGTGNTRVVTLTNVKSAADADNYITVKAGAIVDAAGNSSKAVTASKFTVKVVEIEEEKPVPPPIVDNKDKIAPVVKIAAPTPKAIYSKGTVKYAVTFSDNIKVTDVNLIASKVKLVGFTADVNVKVNGVKSALITLKNVKGTVGTNKYIKIASGVALDAEGNRSAEAISQKFSIIEKAKPIRVPVVTKYTNNCIDDLKLLGDINEEITYFASWLRAEKYTATYVQENNYVAEDERMTYMVEYYNGSTAPSPNVTFDLTIPYKVEVEEINGGGKITKQTEDETVITWNIGKVPSYVAQRGSGFCRLFVRVKFLENKELVKSDNISEVFYATLKTTAGGNNSYSYMRQLFIDTTEGKTGTYAKYLTTIDSTNQVRPDDEITRAEFAKLLADSGILDIEVGSKGYKTFKDHESIPSYARDAVSALAKTDIIQAFPDGEFKPENPILMEDAMQMIAQAATYISDQKLTVYKPVFLYTKALTGKDGKVSPKKDYIMELMRENVVVKYESNPDSYALRKDVVAMVNSLTFRGPYVETLPENTLKYADIRDDSVFFYNIVGASNSYKYTYDYRLWQQIVEVQ